MKIYQISTLQALALGYTRAVTTVEELLKHGDIGLGTFEDVNGEMIVVDGGCYRATEDGTACEADPDMGVPFASVAKAGASPGFEIEDIANIGKLKEVLTLKIEEDFGLNSMHIARIDGEFPLVRARSESASCQRHSGTSSLKILPELWSVSIIPITWTESTPRAGMCISSHRTVPGADMFLI